MHSVSSAEFHIFNSNILAAPFLEGFPFLPNDNEHCPEN